jgi:hypothetical protein
MQGAFLQGNTVGAWSWSLHPSSAKLHRHYVMSWLRVGTVLALRLLPIVKLWRSEVRYWEVPDLLVKVKISLLQAMEAHRVVRG